MTSTVEHRFDDGITGNQAFAHEPGDERVCILVRGILPRRTVQPERSRRGSRQRDITPIAKRSRKKRRPERSQLEADRHPVAIGGTIDERCPGFRPADGEKGLAVKPGHHHLPMTGHYRQEFASAFAPRRPDALDEWRIRRAIFKRQEHVRYRGRLRELWTVDDPVIGYWFVSFDIASSVRRFTMNENYPACKRSHPLHCASVAPFHTARRVLAHDRRVGPTGSACQLGDDRGTDLVPTSPGRARARDVPPPQLGRAAVVARSYGSSPRRAPRRCHIGV
jgi:hypothetical protein